MKMPASMCHTTFKVYRVNFLCGVIEIKLIISESLACIRRARKIEPSTEIELSALRWEIYAALQNILDAMAMIMVELGLTEPGTCSELGRALHKSGLLSHEEAMVVKQIAVTRNMLAHAYRRLSEGDLRKLVQELLPRAENRPKARRRSRA